MPTFPMVVMMSKITTVIKKLASIHFKGGPIYTSFVKFHMSYVKI